VSRNCLGKSREETIVRRKISGESSLGESREENCEEKAMRRKISGETFKEKSLRINL
jgi:hypothetical protein